MFYYRNYGENQGEMGMVVLIIIVSILEIIGGFGVLGGSKSVLNEMEGLVLVGFGILTLAVAHAGHSIVEVLKKQLLTPSVRMTAAEGPQAGYGHMWAVLKNATNAGWKGTMPSRVDTASGVAAFQDAQRFLDSVKTQ